MEPGRSFADRFRLDAIAGVGGMGEVWRAQDQRTGSLVALKLLRADAAAASRFVREAEVLSTLSHSAIVRYVAHGVGSDDRLYLAMEWLEGEDLEQRLSRGPLTMDGSIELGRRIASALAHAHERGIVHRDLKPSNLFLVGGKPDEVRVLDFGIARVLEATKALTRTGVFVGTPGYASPEQARGSSEVGPAADIFALGCVLFECITGQEAFPGTQLVAVLAKLLLADPPRLGALRPQVPTELDELVTRMLSKAPADRPASAADVAVALDQLRVAPVRSSSLPPPTSLSPRERRMTSVLLAGLPSDLSASAATLPESEVSSMRETLERLVVRAEGRVEPLVDGTLLILLQGSGEAVDRVERAATLALQAKETLPELPIVLATGWTQTSVGFRVGEVIDRAVGLLGRAAKDAKERRIWIDSASAGLLTSRFHVEDVGDASVLYGEVDQERADATNALPLVGRQRLMARLDDLVDEALEERFARVISISGPPGIGKSRVREELRRRLIARAPEPTMWFARGDSMRRAVPLSLLRQMLERSVLGTAPHGTRRSALRSFLSMVLPLDRVAQVELYLAEVLELTTEEDGIVLAQVRQNPDLLWARVCSAFSELVHGVAKRSPFVIMIEDSHYGDVSSFRVLEAAIRSDDELPICVVSFVRPEGRDVLPLLHTDWDMTIMRLSRLSRRHGVELARAALPQDASDEAVARVARLGDGNPLQIEELARAAARGDDLPPSLAAVLASRLDRLEPRLRTVVRVASIFGEAVPVDGLKHLLGEPWAQSALLEVLAELERAEIFAAHGEQRGTLRFRQGLIRDAAYASLGAADRAQGHFLAATHLQASQSPEYEVIAEHWLRAGRPKDAIPVLLQAAQNALSTGDYQAVIDLAQRALQSGADGRSKGELLRVAAHAHYRLAAFLDASRVAAEALGLLERDSRAWWSAAMEHVRAAALVDNELPAALVDELREVPRSVVAEPQGAILLAAVVINLISRQHLQAARSIAAVLEKHTEGAVDPGIVLARCAVRSTLAPMDGDFAEMFRAGEEGRRAALAMGDELRAAAMQQHMGAGLLMAGDYVGAARQHREVLDIAIALRDDTLRRAASSLLAHDLVKLGELKEARPILEELYDWAKSTNEAFFASRSSADLALLRFELGDFEEAEQIARELLDDPRAVSGARPLAVAVLAQVLMERGCEHEALAQVSETVKTTEAQPAEPGDALLRLLLVRLYRSTGREAEAEATARAAYERLMVRAACISDERMRTSFLQQPEHAETVALVTREAP